LTNSGLESVSGFSSLLLWTATTPSIPRTVLTVFAGMDAATPPYTVRSLLPTCALGTALRKASTNAFSREAT